MVRGKFKGEGGEGMVETDAVQRDAGAFDREVAPQVHAVTEHADGGNRLPAEQGGQAAVLPHHAGGNEEWENNPYLR